MTATPVSRDSDSKFLQHPSFKNSVLMPVTTISLCTVVGALTPFMVDAIEEAGGLFQVVGFNALGALAISVMGFAVQNFIMSLKRHFDNPHVLFFLDCLHHMAGISSFIFSPLVCNLLFDVPFIASGLSALMGLGGLVLFGAGLSVIHYLVTALSEFNKETLTSSFIK